MATHVPSLAPIPLLWTQLQGQDLNPKLISPLFAELKLSQGFIEKICSYQCNVATVVPKKLYILILYAELFLYSWTNPTWCDWMIFSICCWVWSTVILLKFFASNLHQEYWSMVVFIPSILFWIWNKVAIGFIKYIHIYICIYISLVGWKQWLLLLLDISPDMPPSIKYCLAYFWKTQNRHAIQLHLLCFFHLLLISEPVIFCFLCL